MVVLFSPNNVLYLSYFKLQFTTTIMLKFIFLLAEGPL